MRGIQPQNFLTLDEINNNWYELDSKLYWRVSRGTNKKDGSAGSLKPNGYSVVGLRGVNYPIHRILYQIYNNIHQLPTDTIIDHIDGNISNNVKDNLRLATYTNNQHNKRTGRNNTTGYKDIQKGVRITKNGYKSCYWKVIIRLLDKSTISKRFEYGEERLQLAIKYRDVKFKEIHGEFINFK